jgi:hypothetical protein
LLLTEKAFSASDGEGNDNAVSNLELVGSDPSAHFDYFSHELVPHDVALLHGGNIAVIEVQI